MSENTEAKDIQGTEENQEVEGVEEVTNVQEIEDSQNVDNNELSAVFNKLSRKIESDITEKEEKLFLYNPARKIEYGRYIEDVINHFEALIDELGFKVRLYENIDKVNVTKESKFNIKIEDSNGSYITIDYFKYREICLDFTANEVLFISDCLEKLVGNKELFDEELPEIIVGYLSYLIHFKEAQTKIYNTIGWSVYDEEIIFKYDTIYSKSGLLGECIAEYATALRPENYNQDDKLIWLETLVEVMNKSTVAALIISAGISGIFRQMLPYTKETNINMNIQGDRGSGKSTICHFVLSFFGNPEFLEGSFTDTDNAMEIIRAQRPVMPYILDERMLKVEGVSEENKKKTLLLDIFREYEGRVKERAGKQYDDVSGKRTCSPIISSSAEPMLTYVLDNSDLGQFRRFIEINLNGGELFQSGGTAETVEDVSYTYYGYGIEVLISYLFNYNFEDGEGVKQLFDAFNIKIGEILKNKEVSENVIGLTSSAKRFALIVVSYQMLLNALNDFFDGQKASKIQIVNQLKPIIDYLVENIVGKMKQVKVDVNVRKNIVTFVDSHKKIFYQNKTKWNGEGRFVGWLQETDEAYYIYVKKGFNLEWLLVLYTQAEEDKLLNYIDLCDKYSSDKSAKQLKEAFEELVGKPTGKTFKTYVKDIEKVQYSDDNKDSDLRVGSVRYNRIIVERKDFNGVGKEKEDTKE